MYLVGTPKQRVQEWEQSCGEAKRAMAGHARHKGEPLRASDLQPRGSSKQGGTKHNTNVPFMGTYLCVTSMFA